jgi:hypothetical protein
MMKNTCIRWIALGAALLVLFVIVGAVRHERLFSETVAAWVQAIGSILAIVAGFAAGRDQARSAHQENLAVALQADRNARAAAISLATLAQAECANVLARLADGADIEGSEVQRLKRSIEYQRETIAAFSLASLKDEGLMRNFAPLPGALDSVADNLRELADTTMGGRPASRPVVALVVGRLRILCAEGEARLAELRRLAAREDQPPG